MKDCDVHTAMIGRRRSEEVRVLLDDGFVCGSLDRRTKGATDRLVGSPENPIRLEIDEGNGGKGGGCTPCR